MFTVRASVILRFVAPLFIGIGLVFACRLPAQAEKSSYAAVDERALKAPASVTKSVDSLVKYLTAGAKTDLEKTRAIYRWITANIEFDLSGLKGNRTRPVDADEVLRQRRTVCMGYSEIFCTLGKAAGLDVQRIMGFARGFSADGPVCNSAPNHEWNAVKVDGRWMLIDCTWAAGYLQPGPKFVKRYDEFYFDTPPEQFIFDHFPIDSDWQLLKKPLSCSEYEKLITVKPGFFRLGLEFDSHRQSSIRTTEPLEISLKAHQGVTMLAQLICGGKEVPRTYSFIEEDGDRLRISTAFPRAGDYTLRLFAKPKGTAGNCEWVAEYDIEVPSLSKPCPCYPESLSAFMDTSARLISPRAGTLKPGTTQRFRLSVPGAKVVAVIAGKKWTYLQKSGEFFEGDVEVTNERMQVCVNFGNSRDYQVLLAYNTSVQSSVAGSKAELGSPRK